MSLRLKLFLCLFLVLLLYGAVSYKAHQCIMLPSFIALENKKAVSNIERIRGTIEQEKQRLNNFSFDWAAWDDTYKFVLNKNKKYITSNLGKETFFNADIDLIYIFNKTGKVIWGGLLPPGSKKLSTWNLIRSQSLPVNHPLFSFDNTEKDISKQRINGLLMNMGRPLLLVARPIVTSDNKGPTRGTIVMGSFLKKSKLMRIMKQIKVNFEIITDINKISSISSKSTNNTSSKYPYKIEEIDINLLQIYSVYHDLMGNPAFAVKTKMPRDISIQGRKSIDYAFLSILIAGIASMAVMLIILQKTILNPIETGTRLINRIDKGGDYSKRININRHDEIGTISQAFNRLLEKIESQTKELRMLSFNDGLTGLANRRCFDETLQVEYKRMRRGEKPLSLILFDVDYFKRYNDTYGHQAGDECLIKIAKVIKNQARRISDLAARYGGEEFAVVLPETDTEGAKKVAELILSGIRNLEITHSESKVSHHVTISAGISTIVAIAEHTPKILIKTADEALYQAKQQGRDRSYCKGITSI